jgi:hypothetical protein
MGTVGSEFQLHMNLLRAMPCHVTQGAANTLATALLSSDTSPEKNVQNNIICYHAIKQMGCTDHRLLILLGT